MSNRKKRHSRQIVLSLLLFLMAGTIVTIWDYRMSLEMVMAQSESYANRVAGFLSLTLARHSQDNLISVMSSTESLQNHADRIDNVLQAFELVNIKIFDRDGTITHSLNTDVIGRKVEGNEALNLALGGKSTSHVATPEYHRATYGSGAPFSMLETYVPVREPDTGVVAGVYEIYQDYRPLRREILSEMLRSSLTHLLLLGVVGFILFRFGSYTSGVVEEEQKRMIRDLEDRIGERTAELNRSRERINELLLRKEHMFRDLMLSDEYKKDFMGLVSHELRTPLTVIKGYLNLLREGVIRQDSADYDQVLDTFTEETDRLESIVNNILDLSQLDRGVFDLTSDTFDVEELFREAVQTLAKEVEASAIEVEIAVSPEAETFHSDRMKVLQAVGQLLSNAIKFSPRGGSISLSAAPGVRGLLIKVSDRGVGIPAAKVGVIFNMFYQADVSMTRSFEGTGLGLAIVKKITQILGGRVWVESEEGAGSTFFLEIPDMEGMDVPAGPSPDGDESGLWTLRAVPDRIGRSRERSVLVVDDDRDYLEMVRKLMTLEGYAVQVCSTGLEALTALFGRSGYPLPSLVIMDVRMTDIQGFDLCRIIRNNGSTADIPIIIISALAGQDYIDQGLESGANAYLTKPFDIAELLSRVAFLTGQKGDGKPLRQE